MHGQENLEKIFFANLGSDMSISLVSQGIQGADTTVKKIKQIEETIKKTVRERKLRSQLLNDKQSQKWCSLHKTHNHNKSEYWTAKNTENRMSTTAHAARIENLTKKASLLRKQKQAINSLRWLIKFEVHA